MALTKNKPCELGEQLGNNLARMTDKAEERWRQKMGFVLKRCQSCAFTKGTYPNRCLTTVADATKCALEQHPFHCHHGLKGHGPDTVCNGYLTLIATASGPVEAPCKFSDEYTAEDDS